LTLDVELLEAKYSTVAQRRRIRDQLEIPPFAARSFAGAVDPGANVSSPQLALRGEQFARWSARRYSFGVAASATDRMAVPSP
jgi:hypothetical protein